jgi:hypothetical protein
MKTDNFIEKLQQEQLLDLYIVSLISADTLIDVESCDISLEKILELKELIKTANINNKEHYEKIINDAEEIILRDKEYFFNEKSNN